MNHEEIAQELLNLAKELRTHTSYFGELGAENIEPARYQSGDIQEDMTSVQPAIVRAIAPAGAAMKPAVAATPKSVVAEQSQETLFAELSAAAPPVLQSSETLEAIWADLGDCTRCGLCEGRTQVVNTHGNSNARLMFVGEAPGADEDAQGKPFVGRAGQLLTKMIEAMGMKREEVIIGNVNRCRPPGNRQPTLEEAAICRPFLFREIAVIQPKVIVVMGNTALKNLLEVREGITRVRGQFQDFRGIKVMPTFHPAYLLRDPSKKRETWEDLKKVRDYLESTASA